MVGFHESHGTGTAHGFPLPPTRGTGRRCTLTRLDVGASRPFLSHRSGEQIRTRTQRKKNCCFVLAETRRDEATRGRFSDPSSQSPHVSFRFVWVLPPSILTRSFPSSLPTCRRLPVARSRGGSGLRYTRPSPSLVRIIVVGSVGFVAFDGITRSVVFAVFFLLFLPTRVGSICRDLDAKRCQYSLVWLPFLSWSPLPLLSSFARGRFLGPGLRGVSLRFVRPMISRQLWHGI